MKAITTILPLLTILLFVGLSGCKSDKDSPITKNVTQKTSSEKVVSSDVPLENKSDTATSNNSTSETDIENQSPIKEKVENSTPPSSKKLEPNQNKPKANVSKKAPKIEFEELTWDFGKITEGDIVEKKFTFTNTGNAPLEIKAANATCGCTRPSFPFLDIAPGESSEIGVRYNSVGKEGAQNPEVTIESNATPRITKLKLTGFVMPKTD